MIVCLLVVQDTKVLNPLISRRAPLKEVWAEIADISNESFNERLSDGHQAHGLPRLNLGFMWGPGPGNGR